MSGNNRTESVLPQGDGPNLRAHRLAAGVSQNDLASALGLGAAGAISHTESRLRLQPITIARFEAAIAECAERRKLPRPGSPDHRRETRRRIARVLHGAEQLAADARRLVEIAG